MDSPPTPSFPLSLLLLSDSALPLGSFAFSSGLESYLAHHTIPPASRQPITTKPSINSSPSTSTTLSPHNHISSFLSLSLLSISTSMLPYLIAAYTTPSHIHTLDNDLDASISCTVARRASIAQGRALLSVWEKALKNADPLAPSSQAPAAAAEDASRSALNDFSTALKRSSNNNDLPVSRPPANGHLAPLFALVCREQGLPMRDAVWVFLFGHARAVLSAAVRAGVVGPYQCQAVLASAWLKGVLGECAGRGMGVGVGVEEAGQCVPLMDVWGGRHEVLYTRIFNS